MQRIDKFLWFARFYKSRTLAATTVSAGRVRINGARCDKPATTVKIGDVLTFPAGPHVRVIKVLNDGARRGPATEARLLYEDMTPPPEARAEAVPAPADRPKGSGRPTKRDRRTMDDFTRDRED